MPPFALPRRKPPPLWPELLESRDLTAVVLIFNGNAFGPTAPDAITSKLAAQLRAAGHKPMQMALGPITPALVKQLGRKIDILAARGEGVAVAGFSAGGSLAARLAMSHPAVDAALDLYGPLDLADWFDYHEARNTTSSRSALAAVRGHLGGNQQTVDLFSGPAFLRETPILAAFGDRDQNVTIDVNRQSARSSGANIHFTTFKGPHGASASREIVASFLGILDETTPPPQARMRPAARAFPARWRGGGLRG
jgi:dienelactone hydrolase